jgi:hypothetical protein
MFDDGLTDFAGLRVPQVVVGECPEGAVQAPSATVQTVRHGWIKGKFLRNRIPLSWLGRACELGSLSALKTGLAIWYLSGLRGRQDNLLLTSDTLRRFGVHDRSSKYRALKALEQAGLIQV